MVNLGTAPTGPVFINRLRTGGVDVAVDGGLRLGAEQNLQVGGDFLIRPGTHVLWLSIDDDGVVDESIEHNNKKSVRLVVGGPCVQVAPPPPVKPRRSPRRLPPRRP
jgi:hypothetical protein